MKQIKRFNIGKKGLTDGFVGQIRKCFEHEEAVRISILKSACRDKEEADKIGKDLVEKLGKNYTYKLIGYVLSVRKWRKMRG